MTDGSRSSLHDCRILVVEDDWFIVADLVEFLAESGAVIAGPVSNLGDGLDLAVSPEPLDGAILNIALHDRYAYPIADVLRQRGVPFVFATGIDRYAIPPAYADVPHIRKPYETEWLVEALFGHKESRSLPI